MPERRLLDSTQLFASLPDDVVARLRDHATVRAYRRNDTLCHQGDPSNELFIVQSGRVGVAAQSGDGRESVIAILERGGLFGELGLFDGAPRSADVRALTDTRVVALAYDPVREALEDRPELLWIILRILAERLRATDEALVDALFLARTAKRLIEIAGDDETFTLPLTQEELAAMVGASRERVNKALALFVRLGWLEVEGRNHYRILQRDQLELRASL